MGLDISVYTNLRAATLPIDEDNWVDAEGEEFLHNEGHSFLERCPELNEPQIGEYVCGFRAGSYTGYNRFRDQLAFKVSGKPAEDYWNAGTENLPMHDMINFSDCEGYIGTASCKRLADQFTEHLPGLVFDDPYFNQKVREWAIAFKIAADNNGCVVFH